MKIDKALRARANDACELCSSTEELCYFEVPPSTDGSLESTLLVCATCKTQIDDPAQMNPNHWRCLNDSMWSETPAVQVMAWRMLNRLRGEGWPVELLEMLYLNEETLKWAESTGEGPQSADAVIHKDSNGHILEAGDSVVLIKDLKVKGANFTAKRGTAVRRISLVHDNAGQIEGKVDGQHIVILTEFVKKSK